MICTVCGYDPPEGFNYCPACGHRVNPSCELVVVNGQYVITQAMIKSQVNQQNLRMTIDGVQSVNSVLLDSVSQDGIFTLRFQFSQIWSGGYHQVALIDTYRPFAPVLSPIKAEFVQFLSPQIKLEPYVLIKDGLLHFEIHGLNQRLQGILSICFSINGSLNLKIGSCVEGSNIIELKGWHQFGISFTESDLQEVPIVFGYQFWDDATVITGPQFGLTFVDRYRLQSVSYKTPGMEPQEYSVQDIYLNYIGSQAPQTPITIVSYPNPYLSRTWQKDKRYLRLVEGYRDLPSLPVEILGQMDTFDLSLEYDERNLEIQWNRLDHVLSGDSLLHINKASEPGEYNIILCLSITDIEQPDGRAVIRIPLKLIIISKRIVPTGLGIDFGTSRTMVNLFNLDNFTAYPVSLDIHSLEGMMIDQVVASVLPGDPKVFHDEHSGTIYPYICNTKLPGKIKLISYLKRELPGIIKSDHATANQLRLQFETMFETIIRRIMEYCLQRYEGIPQITDVCLGCPTVFNDMVISIYRDYLKNVCSFSLVQPSPDFEITVWDEVWAAFSQINAQCNLKDGYYMVWDMGGGTTDIVLVDKGVNQPGVRIIGFDSDYFGGKDVNNHIRSLIPTDNDQLLTETEIDGLKNIMMEKISEDFRGVQIKTINDSLEAFCRSRIKTISAGLISSLSYFGIVPDKVGILTLGGGSLLRLQDQYGETIGLGDMVRDVMIELLPRVDFQIESISVDPKGCTSMGLSTLANTPNFRNCINRLPGFETRSRYNIVHRDVFGNKTLRLAIGQELESADLPWESNTMLYMVFGGSNLDEQTNPPIVYANPAAWEEFKRLMKIGSQEEIQGGANE